MFEMLRKAILVGVGVTYMTKDKIEELGKKIAKDAKVSEVEAREFVNELIGKSLEAKGELEKNITEKIHAAVHAMNLPTQKDVDELKSRIVELEGQLKK